MNHRHDPFAAKAAHLAEKRHRQTLKTNSGELAILQIGFDEFRKIRLHPIVTKTPHPFWYRPATIADMERISSRELKQPSQADCVMVVSIREDRESHGIEAVFQQAKTPQNHVFQLTSK